ncbi:protein cellulose synthase interactive 3 [Tanacetum coccineum]
MLASGVVVWLVALLTDLIDDSKWAITATDGIYRFDDICSCVKSAEAIPAFLWFLRNGGSKGQEASSKALMKLIRKAKAHTIEVLGHVLSMATHSDLVQNGSDAYKGLRSLVQVINSLNEEAQEHTASVLADLFSNRQDICDSLATDGFLQPCMKLLTSNTQVISTQSARALGDLSRLTNSNFKNKMPYIAEGEGQGQATANMHVCITCLISSSASDLCVVGPNL